MSITAGAHVAKVEMKPRSRPEGAAVTFFVAGGDVTPFQCEVVLERALTVREAEQKAKRWRSRVECHNKSTRRRAGSSLRVRSAHPHREPKILALFCRCEFIAQLQARMHLPILPSLKPPGPGSHSPQVQSGEESSP